MGWPASSTSMISTQWVLSLLSSELGSWRGPAGGALAGLDPALDPEPDEEPAEAGGLCDSSAATAVGLVVIGSCATFAAAAATRLHAEPEPAAPPLLMLTIGALMLMAAGPISMKLPPTFNDSSTPAS